MSKANSPKNKDKKKNKKKKKITPGKKADSLKSLKADSSKEQKKKTVSAGKSLNSLKKIQIQLDEFIKQRQAENQRVKTLEKDTQAITLQLEAIESQFPKHVLAKDFLQIQSDLKKKTNEFKTNTNKLTREITIFKDLTDRVEYRIKSLENKAQPNNKQLEKLDQHQTELFKKISQFENDINQLTVQFKQPEPAVEDLTKQLGQLTLVITELQEKSDAQNQHLLNKIKEQSDSTLATALALSKESSQEQLEKQTRKIAQQTDHLYTLLDNKTSSIEDVQQHFIKPFEHQKKQMKDTLDSLSRDNHVFESQIKLLQSDTADNIKKLFKIEVQSLQRETEELQQINKLKKQRQEQSIELAENIKQLNKETEQIKNHQQAQSNDLTETVQKLNQEWSDKIAEQSRQQQSLNNKIADVEKAQYGLITPLQSHLEQLQGSIQSLNQDLVKQQDLHSTDSEKLLDLNNRVSQFDEAVQESQKELKQHISLLRESDKTENTEKFTQVNDKYDQLSQHLDDVFDQAGTLRSLVNEMQEQQNTAGEQHDELAKQYLVQQQKLENQDSQLACLDPLIEKNISHQHQLEQIATHLNQLSSGQKNLSAINKKIQSNLSKLSKKLNDSHSTNQKNIKILNSQQLRKSESHQQAMEKQQDDHTASLTQLGGQIKKRSQLFSAGLIAVLAVSTLLLFNQDIFQDSTDKQAQIAQIKAAISNETDARINTLAKQNKENINKQLGQLRKSIQKPRQDKPQDQHIELQNAQKDWKNQHQLLQKEVAGIQTEQQTLNQSVSGLSSKFDTIAEQFKQVKRAPAQRSEPSAYRKPSEQTAELTNMNRLTAINETFYSIQLIAAREKESMQHFLQHHKLAEKARFYQTELKGESWYILLYGHYTSYIKAKQQLQKLPEHLLNLRPWVRKIP